MITNFNQYITEKSNLSGVINKNLLHLIHSYYNVNHDIKLQVVNNNYKKLLTLLKKYNLVYITNDNEYLLTYDQIEIDDEEYFESEDDDFINVYYYDNNKLKIIQTSLLVFIMNKTPIIYIFNKYKRVVKNSISKLDLYDLFLLRYKSVYLKLFNNYLTTLKQLLKDSIDKLNFKEFDDKDDRYLKELNNDISYLLKLKQEFESGDVISLSRIIRNEITEYVNTDKTLYHICLLYYNHINDKFNFVRYKKYLTLFEDEPDLFKSLQKIIYDKNIINKFKYLSDANKFDLI